MKKKKLMSTVFLTFAMLLLVNGQPIIKGPAWSFAAFEDEKIEGTVSGAVQEGVNISLTKVGCGETSSESTETEGNGYYKFSDVLNGNYKVIPEKNGYTFSPKFISVIIPNDAAKQIDFFTALDYPGGDYCTENDPCTEGLGDCDADSECAGDLICAQDVGANYGWHALVDVCEN